MRRVLADGGLDQKYVLAYVHTINDCLFARIFAYDIFVEERKRPLVGRCGQSDDEGIKIFKHLLPYVVDGAMAFIYDYAIKEFRRVFRVVNNLFRCLGIGGYIFVERSLLGGFVKFFTFEDGIHSLYGAYTNLDTIGDVGGFQSVDAVNLREGTVVVRRSVGQELAFGLFTKTLGIDEKANAIHLPVFQEPIGRCNGGKCLARAGRHLHQRLGAVFRERLVEVFNRHDLTFPEARGIERRKMFQVVPNRVGLFQERVQLFGTMEGKHGS